MTYTLDKVRVLVVEDMLPMLNVTRSLLQVFGFKHIFSARDGEEGFKIFCEKEPDIIITDWLMEPLNGLEMIRKIRQDPASPNIYVPIILMTGYGYKLRVEQARDNGVTEFLVKPYSARDLYNRIVNLIENPRQFVFSRDFLGPDRRRKAVPFDGNPRRRDDLYESQEGAMKEKAEKLLEEYELDIVMRDKKDKDVSHE